MAREPKMIYCRKCGTQFNKKCNRCPQCGKRNKKPLYLRGWFIVLVIIISIIVSAKIKSNKKEHIDWNNIELSHMIPETSSNIGEIYSNTDSYLSIYIYKTSKDDYLEYKNSCEIYGYTIEPNSSNSSYSAYNDDGYKLSLSYYEDDKRIRITLDAPMDMETIIWPTSGPACLVPTPNSTTGKIQTDSSSRFYAYVGNISKDAYLNYIDQCTEAGFSVDYEKGDTYYNAYDTVGNTLSVRYQGYNVISIEIEVLEDLSPSIPTMESTANEESITETEPISSSSEATVAITEQSTIPTTEPVLVDGMRPEFKEAMDAYEDFYMEYCDFLIEYEENPNNFLLIAKYAELLKKAEEADEAFAKWEDGDLNNAELKYYLDVQNRVMKKLIDIGA